jgi:hypothetical protein
MMTGTTDDRREDSTGSIITGETGLAHAGSIVDNEGSNFLCAQKLRSAFDQDDAGDG